LKNSALRAVQKYQDLVTFWANRERSPAFKANIIELKTLLQSNNDRTRLFENIKYVFPTKGGIPISDSDLANMLFSDRSSTTQNLRGSGFLIKTNVITLSKLFEADFNVQKLGISDLQAIGLRKITESQLNEIKKDVRNIIWDFFYDQSSHKYVGRTDFKMGYSYVQKKYNLIRSMVFAASNLFNDGKFLTLAEAADALNINNLYHFSKEIDPRFDTLDKWSRIFEDLGPSLAREDVLLSIWNFRNLSPRALRAKVGREAHPIWEYYTELLSSSIGLSILTEQKNSDGKIPDHTISRDNRFTSQIESKAIFKKIFREKNLKGVLEFLVDYTLSTAEDNILGKCKKYQANDRFLLIVLYGPLYDDGDILNLQNTIETDGYNKVKIITLNEYFKLMGIDDKIIGRANKKLGINSDIKDMITDILTGPLTLNQREDILDELGEYYEKALNLLKFGSNLDNFLGKK
jgi:hypothetical protein